MTRFRTLRDQGLLFPLGMGIAFALMVAWNGVFVTLAIWNAPEVSPAYTHAVER